jgi:hypothetical protein
LRRLRQLEEENRKLKQLVADLSLDDRILQELVRKSSGARRECSSGKGGGGKEARLSLASEAWAADEDPEALINLGILADRWGTMEAVEFIRSHDMALPVLAKFACGMAIVGIPQLCRRFRLPAAVGLLASGIVIGPYGLDIFGEHRPIADFFAELGKLILMFTTGLEIDLALFRRAPKEVCHFRNPHY